MIPNSACGHFLIWALLRISVIKCEESQLVYFSGIKLFVQTGQIRLLNSKTTDLDLHYSEYYQKCKILTCDLLICRKNIQSWLHRKYWYNGFLRGFFKFSQDLVSKERLKMYKAFYEPVRMDILPSGCYDSWPSWKTLMLLNNYSRFLRLWNMMLN